MKEFGAGQSITERLRHELRSLRAIEVVRTFEDGMRSFLMIRTTREGLRRDIEVLARTFAAHPTDANLDRLIQSIEWYMDATARFGEKVYQAYVDALDAQARTEGSP